MFEINSIFFETINSTNTYAKENADNLPMPSLIVANEQTEGRGRRGNSFFSPKDTGLYMTIVFPAPENYELLTPAAAIAVCKELETIGIEPKIKWVNDIYVNNRKVCGILTECFIKNNSLFIALGIGINLTTKIFPDELTVAGSINKKCDKVSLAKKIAQHVIEYSQNNNSQEILSEYKTHLFVLGKNITYTKDNKNYSAVAVDINEQCNLIVRRSDGFEETLSSGEISIKL